MKRISILLVLLMAFVAACGSGTASPSATDTDTETPDPMVDATDTPEPTEAASAEPGSSGGTAFEGDLADALPDELNGVARTDITGMDSMIASALGGQGLDASEAQWVFASYGDGADSVIVNAFAIPGMDNTSLDLFARSMAGVPGITGAEAEADTIGGKSVLRLTGGAQAGNVYIYVADGAVFSVISQNADLAEQLLGELP